MLLLGHMGIGARLVKPWRGDLPLSWIYLGAALPDILDKPLYYILVQVTGRYGADLGLISSTRTFGHSGLLILIATLLVITGSSRFTALSLGLLTHAFLDVLGDTWEFFDSSATAQALLFPLLGFKFYASEFKSMAEHASSKKQPYLLVCEVIGVLLLLWDGYDYRKRKKRAPESVPSDKLGQP